MEEKTKTIAVYESTHYELQLMAVKAKLSIKKFLQELVAKEKSQSDTLEKIRGEHD